MILILIVFSLLAPRVVEFVWLPPQVEIALNKAPGQYAHGFDVEGIKWRDNFLDYRLVFKNKDTRIELTDLRIDLQFPAVGVVRNNILFSKGVETVSAAPFGLTAAKGNKVGQRIEPIEAYSTNLLVTAIRTFSSAEFTARIILVDPFAGRSLAEDKSTMNGAVCVSFYYDDFWDQKTKQSTCYPLIRGKNENEEELELVIDIQNPIPPQAHKLQPGVVFDPPRKAQGLNVILSPNP